MRISDWSSDVCSSDLWPHEELSGLGGDNRSMNRLLAMLALAAAVLLATAGVASAHVDVEAEEPVAGATTTVTFSFHHGKDGTATTGLEVKLPDGASVVEVPEVPGWTIGRAHV